MGNRPTEYDTNSPSRDDNLNKSKRRIFDIAMMNDWNYFVTFTLDQKLIDRTNIDEVSKKFKKWLNNMVTRNDFQYLFVFEHHKDGKSIHMHGLTNDKGLKLIPSINPHTGKPLYTKSGQLISNIKNWHYGYSTCIPLYGDPVNVAKYITKYITKDAEKIAGHYYYAGGKKLIRKPIEYVTNFDPEFLKSPYFDSQHDSEVTRMLLDLAIKTHLR